VTSALWPLLLYFLAVVVLLAAILGISSIIGETHSERTTGEPYESGMKLTGGVQARHGVSFYLIAVFFVIFDLEAAFLIAWALAARESGWAGYMEIVVFIGVLLVGLVYLWRVGALETSSAEN
jgi:NADH-quinone oxidoreductase subunit A